MWQVRRSFDSLCSLRMTNRVLHTNATVGPVGPPLPGWPGRTTNRRAGFDFPCHCEERSDVAISWYIVRICTISQEIATAFGLAMTVVVGRWCGFAGVSG